MVNQTLQINVARITLYSDLLRNAKKGRFDPKKELKVYFAGEDSIDLGGPKRELFRLWLNALMHSRVLAGGPTNKVVTNNFMALQCKEYYYVGMLLVVNFIQGGEAFPVFAQPVYDYIAGQPISKIEVPVEDIPDPETRHCIQLVCLLNLYLAI